MKGKQKFFSLQGLRCLAFLGIFIEHCGINALGCWGVSIFLVMSGFLMGIHANNNSYDNTFKKKISICFNKIKRLYPLHVITFFASIGIYYGILKTSIIINWLLFSMKVIFNLSLCQSLVSRSDFYFSFNSVSWYLSTFVFIIFLFQYIERYILNKSIKQLISISLGVFVVQVIISVLLLLSSEWGGISIPAVVSDDITKYITYIFPIYRLLDFIIGFIAGRLFVNLDVSSVSVKKVYILQIIGFAVIPLLQLVYYAGVNHSIMDPFRYSLLYQVDALVLVVTFALNKGFINKFFSKKMFTYIGDLSGYCFLIHQLVIVVVRRCLAISDTILQNIAMSAVSFIITICLAALYDNILRRKN